jgi:hypothetical protein
MIIISLVSTIISFLTSGMLAGEIGEKKKRGLWPYFILGLFLGPLALILFLVPGRTDRRPATSPPGKPLRVLRGKLCPVCNNEIPVHASSCPGCGGNSGPEWWETADF